MAINFTNGMIGLSLLNGSNSLGFTSAGFAGDTAAVITAKKAFNLPATTPPWMEDPSNAPVSAQISALKRMISLVDPSADNKLANLPDVQTAFTSFKALDRLRLLAETAAKSTTSSAERAALDKIFAKGLVDLRGYLGSAETDLLTLNFASSTRRTDSVGIHPSSSNNKLIGEGLTATRDAPLPGLTGTEVLKISLTRGTMAETVIIDLGSTPQPPTLDSIAAAVNAGISATIARDANGQPINDADGNATSQWKSHFTVEKNDGKWGLVFNASGIEKASLDQVNAGDALMIASGRTAVDGPKSAQIFRIDNPASDLSAQRLSTINAIDSAATAKAQAAAKTAAAAAAKKGSVDSEAVQHVVYAPTDARGIATDAQGYSYVVGTSAGDFGSSLSDGANDLYLTKVNSEGDTVWMRNLGASGTGEGVAVTIGANGQIVVAGTVSGAFSGGNDSETDMLVAQFDSQGTQRFATAIRQMGNESATAVAVGDDGSIFLAGRASSGGGDAMLVRLDANGKMQEKRILDSGGSDRITALAIDDAGQLLALSKQNEQASLMRFDTASLSNDLGTTQLGAVDARAIAVADDGEIAIIGATREAAAGDQIGSISGARDAFVTRISADGSQQTTTYIGTDADDQADSVTYMNGALYVGGRTSGTLGDAKSGKVDGFVARIDLATGTVGDVEQWGLVTHTAEPVQIAAATGGATALGALGFARGTLNQSTSAALSSQTILREGDRFSLRVNGGATRSITIAKDETMISLAQKIQRITGQNGNATSARVDGKQVLRIQAGTGHSIELIAGPDGKDALAKLGMTPVRLVATPPKPEDAPKVTPGGVYNLNLNTTINLKDVKAAEVALNQIKSALSMNQSAYRSLYWDDAKTAQITGNISGGGSAYQNARLAQYQAALSRLGG